MLNKKQQLAVNFMKQRKNVFLTGEAGTGKSYVIDSFREYCEENGIELMICAPTGIAALNVKGATLHRTFKIPLQPLINKVSSLPIVLKDVDVLIIDEISIVRIDVFDYVAQSIIALNKYRRMKGKPDLQVILVGDFFQLPPVITDKDREILTKYKYGDELGSGFAFNSIYWKAFGFINIVLDEVVRQTDKNFIINLNNIRKGIPSAINYFNAMSCKTYIENAILICVTNREVNEKNMIEFMKIKDKEHKFEAEIDGTVAESDKIVPEDLRLKVGCRVMTVINDVEGLYQNGTLATVTAIKEDKIQILTDDGEYADIFRYTWQISNYIANTKGKKVHISLDKIGSYTQFPLKLAYAATVHKTQGQTFDKANLNPSCWDYGQLYVALSRVKDINRLHLTRSILPYFLKTADEVKQFYSTIS